MPISWNRRLLFSWVWRLATKRNIPPTGPESWLLYPPEPLCSRPQPPSSTTIYIVTTPLLLLSTTRQFRPVAPEQPAERKFRPVVEQRQQEVMLQDVCNCLHITYVSMYALPAATSSQRRFIHAVLASHLWCKCVKTCLESNSDGNSSGETGRTPSSTTSG